jgi:N-acetylneuraminate synthase
MTHKFFNFDQKPYIIAEMSGNHNNSLERALQIVDAAAASGASALKIQTYTPDTMTLNLKTGEFFIEDPKSLWRGRSLYDLYAEAMTPWEWHEPIKNRCEEKGIDFFSTPFDSSSVEFLEKLGVKIYKIASFEVTDLPLIKRVAQTKKPVIMSTGMATLQEIQEAIDTLKNNGCTELVILKCTSAYPAPYKDMNISTIKDMREKFKIEVGLSDHTLGTTVPVLAVAYGANVIEKHFTLKRADGGVDSAFSLEPNEFKEMVESVQNAKSATGRIHYGLSASEEKSRIFRRSIYFSKDVKKGEKLTMENIKVIRPALGLEPKHLDAVLGRVAREDYKMGTPLSWDRIS